MYHGDVEAAGAPSSVVQLRDAIREADVLRGFEPHVSQSYHNPLAHLARVARFSPVLVAGTS
jgi:hypothetical protein